MANKMKDKRIYIRVEGKLKSDAQKVLDKTGIDMSTFLTAMLLQLVKQNK